MAYEIGTATDATNLRTLLTAFAVANGWTDTSGVLSKGSSFVRLTVLDALRLQIEGSTDGAFGAGLCPQVAKINIEATAWPVTYRFFSMSSPDLVTAVLNYDVSRIQMMWFGQIVKYGTWTGGAWFGAAHSDRNVDPVDFYMDQLRAGGTVTSGPIFETSTSPAAPFWGTENRESFGGGYAANRNAFVHAEIDGNIWPGAGLQNLVWPSFPGNIDPMHVRQPNAWNSQAVLLTMRLFMQRADSFYSPIGHLAHIRAIKVDNYNLADIITIGPDRWMVFPWHKKDLTAPDGGLNPNNEINHSGTFGAAIAYDGP